MNLLPALLAQATDVASAVDNATHTDSGLSLDVEMLIPYGITILKVLVILFIGWIIAGWARRITRKAMNKAGIDLTLSKFVSNMAKWAVLAIVFITVLGIFGIETTSFAALIAAGGLAVGLAFQGTLGNMASGIMLLVFRPFKVGDVINAAGVVGKVDEIELFTTTLDTPDNRRIIIPNGAVFGSTIENISHHENRRVDVAVGVDYGAGIDETRAVLEKVVASIDNVLADPASAVVLGDLGDSAVGWTCRVWVNSADYWGVKEALTREVKMQLDAAGIGIPFPQMDVHIDGALTSGA